MIYLMGHWNRFLLTCRMHVSLRKCFCRVFWYVLFLKPILKGLKIISVSQVPAFQMAFASVRGGIIRFVEQMFWKPALQYAWLFLAAKIYSWVHLFSFYVGELQIPEQSFCIQ